jgi:hypothetical protein
MRKNEEVVPAVKMELIQQERQIWLNTRELWTIRHRVFKRLDNKEQMVTAEKELESCEKALIELDNIFLELQQS